LPEGTFELISNELGLISEEIHNSEILNKNSTSMSKCMLVFCSQSRFSVRTSEQILMLVPMSLLLTVKTKGL
jgi:hypothetical protein